VAKNRPGSQEKKRICKNKRKRMKTRNIRKTSSLRRRLKRQS